MRKKTAAALLSILCLAAAARADDAPPTQWVDPATGHRVFRLSTEPGSASLYFHQNAYSPDGRKLLITTPGGLSTVDLQTREVRPLVEGKVSVIVVGRKSGDVYYVRDGTLFATNLESAATRQMIKLPPRTSLSTLNADETLLAGAITEGPATRPAAAAASEPAPLGPDGQPLNKAEAKEVMLDRRLNQRTPMALITVNVNTGERKTFDRCTDWLNHLQFSPTDPGLLMFCHEGPWHKVDRVWTIRVDGKGDPDGKGDGGENQPRKVHARTMNMEIAGHEFWAADGSTIWYDLQTPRGEDFWVAGLNLASGLRTWYHLDRDQWSVHFNVSRDGKLFAGDGGDDEMVAHAKDGKWIYLFRPEPVPDLAGPVADKQSLIQSGVFKAERLVDMSKHNYHLEPNVTFSPDGKLVVFRSNMFGPEQVFAVEVAKAQ